MLAALLLLSLTAAASAAPGDATCINRCIVSGNCCTGNSSGCAHPSCQMGCTVGSMSASLAACKSACNQTGCTFKFQGLEWGMCGDCSARWLDPVTKKTEVLPVQPYWPPGFGLAGCMSCDDTECELGCELAFDPSLNPLPPAPTPPPPAPLPAAPWPNRDAATAFNFSVVFSDSIVLQQAPAAAAVYGNIGSPSGSIAVTVTPSSGAPYTVPATAADGRWKALLKPTPATYPATTFTITAACTAGCSGSATIRDVVFGDVFFCHGQSNQWLPMKFTYAFNSSLAALQTGKYDSIRIMAGDSQSEGLSPSYPPTHPWRTLRDAAARGDESWAEFSAACYHFAEALVDQHLAAGKQPPVLGMLNVAIGGSVIEEWVTNDVAEKCFGAQANANGGELNHILWDATVRAYLDMTLKGWLYYQVRGGTRGSPRAGAISPTPASTRPATPPPLLSTARAAPPTLARSLARSLPPAPA